MPDHVERLGGSSLSLGKLAEQAAASYLEGRGMIVVDRNYRCKLGEIDIIARDDTTLVFCEVRYRRHSHFGTGAESVNPGKMARIIKTAQVYLLYFGLTDRQPVRFDVINMSGIPNEFEFDWIPNAFEAN